MMQILHAKAAALVLLALISAGHAVTQSSGNSSSAVQDADAQTPAELSTTDAGLSEIGRFLPDDTHLLVLIRVEQLLKSEAWQEVEQVTNDAEGMLSTIAPVRTIYGIEQARLSAVCNVLTSNGEAITVLEAREPIPVENVLVDIRGQYREVEIGPYRMFEEESYGSPFDEVADALLADGQPEQDEPEFDGTGDAYCLVKPNLLLLAPANAVRAILERDREVEFPPALQAAMEKAELSRSIVVVGGFSKLREQDGEWKEVPAAQAIVDSADTLVGHIRFDGDVVATARLECKDAAAAQAMLGLANGGLTMAKLAPEIPQQVLDVINMIQLSADGANVNGSVSIPKGKFAQVLQPIQLANSSDLDFLVEMYAEELESADPDDRRFALFSLSDYGEDARPVVPAIIRLLDDADDGVRQEAIRTIGELGSVAEAAIPKMIELTSDDDPSIRVAALEELGRIGAGGDAVAALLQATHDEDVAVQGAAIRGLMDLGPAAAPAAPRLAELLNDFDNAHHALRRIGPDAKAAIPALMEHALDHDYSPADQALVAIGDELVADLIDVLNGDLPVQQARAARVLAEYGPRAKSATAALSNLLDEERDDSVRGASANALAAIGPEAVTSALPAMIGAVEDRVNGAANAVRIAGPSAKEAVPALIARLNPFDEEYHDIIDALAAIGPNAIAALESLREAAAYTQQFESEAPKAIRAIWKINGDGDKAAARLAALAEGLDVFDSNKAAALDCLAELGPAAAPALPAMLKLASSEEAFADIRIKAVNVIGAIGPEAESAIPALLAMLNQNEEEFGFGDFGNSAALALAHVAPDSTDVAVALTRVTRDFSHRSNAAAALALANMGPTAKLAVPALEETLGLGGSFEGIMESAYAVWKLDGQTEAPRQTALQFLNNRGRLDKERLLAIELLKGLGAQNLGPQTNLVIEALSEVASGDENNLIRAAAYEALTALDPSTAATVRRW